MSDVKAIFEELFQRYPALEVCRNEIWKAYEIIKASYENGGKLLIAGNGGSAADSEHIVGELMKGFVKPRKLSDEFVSKLKNVDEHMGEELGEKLQGALPAIALVDHVALSTAYLNDVDPLLGFAQQINGYGDEDDVFLAISTSGNSKNILYACTIAKAKGMKVVGLTGKDGGKLKDMSDVAIIVPESETFKIQELHLPVYHCLCLMLEETFY
mgnify:FL=1